MRRYAAVVVVLAAGALAIVWWGSSSAGTGVVTQARQAFGDRREVHVVASLGIDPHAPAMRPILSGEGMEVWYDTLRHRTHAVLRRGTRIVLDSVEDVLPAYVPPVEEATALYEFFSGYRPALAHGMYRASGSARIEGRQVVWLTDQAGIGTVDVAIDPSTYQPLWLRSDDSPLTQLAVAETKPYDPNDFLTAKQRKARHL
jgi:hypothetical protein